MERDRVAAAGDDVGVPQALPRALRALVSAAGAERIDRVWVFPPLRRGRRETGLVAAGCYTEGDRRLLATLSYRSEETGVGVAFESSFQEEGEAPSDRLPRVMEGVVRRTREASGDPRSCEVGGDPERLAALLRELDPESSESGPEPPSPEPNGVEIEE